MSEKVNAPEISVKNVSMVFSDSKGNPVQALKNVSIDIQKGYYHTGIGNDIQRAWSYQEQL